MIFLCQLTLGVFVFGVLAVSETKKVEKQLTEAYAETYLLFVKSGGGALTEALTFIHNFFHCCGRTGIPLIEIVKKTCPKPDDIKGHFVMPSCPVAIPEDYDSWSSRVVLILLGFTAFLTMLVILCGVLISKIRQSLSYQYVILTNSSPALITPQPVFQPVSSCASYQNSMVFTPAPNTNFP
uniref:Tetraspanin n=1 Tax=Kryptolebias marmoratus TaxID=37003 RepID=A0A3Q3AMN6_KRYMA